MDSRVVITQDTSYEIIVPKGICSPQMALLRVQLQSNQTFLRKIAQKFREKVTKMTPGNPEVAFWLGL